MQVNIGEYNITPTGGSTMKIYFAYFKGVCESIVYDQTKLVVIREDYREVILNDRFYRFALQLRFKPGNSPQTIQS